MAIRYPNNPVTSQRGIALLVVLWMLTILMTTVFSFSLTARTETYSTLSFKEGMENKYLAEAGVERAISEIYFRRKYQQDESAGVWRTDQTSYDGRLGNGYYVVRMTDESGKLDINSASDVLLKNLLLALKVKNEDVETIVDSIMDWRDADELHRLYGAESDYYMSLPAPYKAKNADFDTLEELLLVKGVTEGILYGAAGRKGIIEFLTVSTKNNRVNANSAPKEVLMAVPGMTPEIADSIIRFRQTKEIRSVPEIQQIVGDAFALMAPYIFTGDTATFTIESTGHKGIEKTGYHIKATVMIDGTNRHRYLYYRSPAIGRSDNENTGNQVLRTDQ